MAKYGLRHGGIPSAVTGCVEHVGKGHSSIVITLVFEQLPWVMGTASLDAAQGYQ